MTTPRHRVTRPSPPPPPPQAGLIAPRDVAGLLARWTRWEGELLKRPAAGQAEPLAVLRRCIEELEGLAAR